MEQLKAEFAMLEKSVADVRNILHEVHGAIVGNPLSKDGGIAQRLVDAENEIEKVKLRLEIAEKKQIKYNLYTIIMWASLGGVASFIIAYTIQAIFKH